MMWFKKLLFWCYLKIHLTLVAISMALFNTEQEILKADPNDLGERDKKETRKLHRNQTLEKFNQGQTDEKYVKDYYEVLKKADKFMRTATPYQMAVAADKYAKSYGQADEYGRKFEHFGFFDDKHKYAGLSLEEVLVLETEERRTKDDDYELLLIYDNKPVEVGLEKLDEIVTDTGETETILDVVGYKTLEDGIREEIKELVVISKLTLIDNVKKANSFTFPIIVTRKNLEAKNKIEQLAEALHIKKIGFEHRQLEFHIPLKFKTFEFDENSAIFAELKDIDEVYITDKYGELTGFKIIDFIKRIKHNNAYDVIKFHALEMKRMGL